MMWRKTKAKVTFLILNNQVIIAPVRTVGAGVLPGELPSCGQMGGLGRHGEAVIAIEQACQPTAAGGLCAVGGD